ncbi:MAG: type II toxin-antitoxin system death-on-curing family toxin [Parachlamydia sp.]|jgi:death-on-curing protein|nr:type II toxin-antitoxin system death-on-curing family toxin [Parachlamydia sp.]
MIEYLTMEQVIDLQQELIKRYGGLPGIRDKGLLESALHAPETCLFGEEMFPTVYDKAAAYLYHIICNHPFIDANKRTGAAVTLIFLEANNQTIRFSQSDFEDIVLDVARNNIDKEQIAQFLSTGFIGSRMVSGIR